MFDDLLKNPTLKKALAAGEERVGKAVAAVLGNEKVMAGVQRAVSSALEARAVVEKGVKTAMQAVNLPTTEDVAELKKRLAELESIIDGLAARPRPAGPSGRGRQRLRDGGGEAGDSGPGPDGQGAAHEDPGSKR
jgi:hypothetical protein